MTLDHAACYRAMRTRDARFDGKLFVGVKTTGIYCRPVCPAPTPKPKNVVFFETAAAAQEAGFRPCLRCRPETAPELAAWRGTSNTVSRALALIENGALDDASVDALAARLGVGERQLRRLFDQHLGASPITVAQTRRVHLAKQLLHETRMPITDVALAAGFGSIRRFNETFRALFKRAPSAFRRASSGSGLPQAGEVTLLLRYRPPYDWPAMLGFLEARAIPGVEAVHGNTYSRTIEADGVHGTVSVTTAAGNALQVTIRLPRVAALQNVIARLRRVFDLGADPIAIGEHLSEDAMLQPLVHRRPGLRVPGAWDGFELAVRAILGQQITVVAARRLAGDVVGLCGTRLSAPCGIDGLTHVFPSAARVALGDVSSLRMPKARIAAIAALASALVERPRLLDPRNDLDEAVASLRVLAGIGDWTAQYIAMRAMAESDAFPAADVGLLRAASHLIGRDVKPGELAICAERWRPWRAYAAQHLWASLADETATRAVAAKTSIRVVGSARARSAAIQFAVV